jgi:hypothetical protein
MRLSGGTFSLFRVVANVRLLLCAIELSVQMTLLDVANTGAETATENRTGNGIPARTKVTILMK